MWHKVLTRTFLAPSLRHQEPKHLSWQWLARKNPEVTGCKDLCFPKSCPKPSFFPRFKKHHIPKEKKSCTQPKKPMTWKEYFSFLFPDPMKKPPLITCRKLQAERRRSCENPHDYPGYCLNENCCPPAKEWFGQAVVYKVPNPFPVPVQPVLPRPCAKPRKTSIRPDDDCSVPKKPFDMDAYAYRRPFSNISVCDAEYSLPTYFPCSRPCFNEHEKSPSCRNYHGIKGTTSPTYTDAYAADLPVVMCRASDEPPKPKPMEFQVEVKKGICERHSLLKPFKTGTAESCRKYHTLNKITSNVAQSSRKYSGSADPPTINAFSPMVERNSWLEQKMSGSNLDSQTNQTWNISELNSPLSKEMNETRAYSCEFKHYEKHYETSPFSPTQGIDPKLLKLMDESNKNIKYAQSDQNTTESGAKTLIKVLSDETNKRLLEKSKETGERMPTGFNKGDPQTPYRNKFSLCKSRGVYDTPKSNFSTHCVIFGRKGDNKTDKSGKKKIICSGCPGVQQAEEEERNPKPKSFIDCKVRPAGRCRGPTTELKPGEKEPDNPYYRHKAKPYSLCNKPRPQICKKERGYKMPCEETKRKFHTSSFLWNSAPKFVPLYDIIKSRGNFKKERYVGGQTNPWDSHTVESYLEIPNSELVPDLTKVKGEQLKVSPRNAFAKKHLLSGGNVFPGFPRTIDECDISGSRMAEDLSGDSSNNKKPIPNVSENNSVSIPEISSLAAEEPLSIWETKSSASEHKKTDDGSMQSSYDSSEIGRGYYVSLKKPSSSENLDTSQPTKFSKMFDSVKKEKRIKQEPTCGMFSKNRGSDAFNPMEE